MKGLVTLFLFAVAFGVFLYQLTTGVLIGLNPTEIHLMDFIAYTFFHSSSAHLACNLAALLFFGHILEEKIGSERFFLLFLVTTIFAGITYVLIYPFSTTPCVGLSGFVFGCIGGNLIAYKGKYKDYFILFVFFYLVFTFFLIYTDSVGNIAHAAHLGGFLMGAVLGLCYEKRREGYILMAATICSTIYLVGS
jgi:membrane associated rhomboid family serine protease